jgi:CHAT domain-containing protein/tetratricopeptide (TPR) repeat protein
MGDMNRQLTIPGVEQAASLGRSLGFVLVLSFAGVAIPVANAQTPAPKPAAAKPSAQTPKPAAQAQKPAAQQGPAVDDRRWSDLADQAEDHLAKGSFAAAEAAGRDMLDEAIRIFPREHPNIAASHSILGSVHFKQGRYADAEAQFRQALNIYETRSGAEAPQTASALNNLALVLEKTGDYRGAELLLQRSLGILRKLRGPDHADTATTMSNLGRVLDAQGKFGDSANIAATAGGTAGAAADDPQVLTNRASDLAAKGQFREAESLQQRVVQIHEKAVGPEHPLTATSVSNLGNMLYLQGKFAEAEQVHRRALAIRTKVLGPGHPDTATSLNNLANVLFEQGKDEQLAPSEQRARARDQIRVFTETEDLYRRALAVQEASLGPEHPSIGATLNNLGALLDQRGRNTEAEPLQRRALAVLEKGLGALHPDTAATLTSLAVSLDRQGKIVEAETIYRRAVETSRNAANPRSLLLNASRLGFALAKRGRNREALPFYRDAIDALDFLYVRTRGLSEETRAAFLGQFGNIYLETIKLLLQLHRTNPNEGFDRQILEIASRNQSRVFTELMRQADVGRFSSEPAFITLRDRRQALHDRIDGLRQAIVTVPVGQPQTDARRADLASQLDGSTRELALVDRELLQRYPRFMELTNPKPVTVDDLQQRLLRDGEMLLTYVLLPQETVIFAVTRERLKMVTAAVKREDIAARIYGVRRAIEKVASGESVLTLRDVDPAVLSGLYRDLVSPVADVMAGRSKIIVVADGPLQTIPLEFLVRQYGAPEEKTFRAARQAADGSDAHPYLVEYAPLDYLGKSFRFAYLPSLSTLTSQRLYPKSHAAPKRELVAFADPIFNAVPGKPISPETLAVLDAMGGSVPRGRDGRPFIPSLKETAEEAREIATILGGESDLYIGDHAQESMAKRGDLKAARFVLFATHGFLGGEYLPPVVEPSGEPGANVVIRAAQKSKSQPALALTLVGDLKGEDGMLTMKEVIEDVELNADLVALSACNTAGETAQANNGEGFAGLTRAFMYAGAKAMLVSHWSVDNLSTQALMTGTFRNVKGGKAALESLSDAQRGLLSARYTSGQFHFSRGHPFFWAPFVYVGD